MKMKLSRFIFILFVLFQWMLLSFGKVKKLQAFSTKTPYWIQEGSEKHSNPPKNCKSVQINYVIRHGTRNPSLKDINSIAELAEKIRRQSNAKNIPVWLANWTLPYKHEEATLLVQTGINEMESLGKRLRERYKSLLPKHYSMEKFVFRHTDVTRTKQSASAFAYGLFNGFEPVSYHAIKKKKDKELRFFDQCQKYFYQIDNNATVDKQKKLYLETKRMKRTVSQVSSATGLKGFRSLSHNDAITAHTACSFDAAVHGTTENWCSLFDNDALLALDYYKDLKAYWKKGYGYDLDWEISTPLLRHIYHSMLDLIAGKSKVVGHFRFAHAETILPLACMLQLSKGDGHLLATTPEDVAWNRLFRASHLAPFGANIGFILYKCDEAKDYRIKLIANEKEVHISGCADLYCPLSTFSELYKKYLEDWNYDEQCYFSSSRRIST